MQVSLEEFRRQISVLLDPDLPAADERYQLLGTLDPYPEIPPFFAPFGSFGELCSHDRHD